MSSLLSYEFCIGLIGGKGNRGYYFVGKINNELIYLDPHYVENKVDFSNYISMYNTYFSKDF